MKVEVKGLAEVERRIDAARKQLGLKAGDFADKSAQVLRDTVVRNAQPFGVGKKAREMGEKAILSDLHDCFEVIGNRGGGRGVIRSVGEAASWHRQRRNSRGRVDKGKRRPVTAAAFGALYQGLKAKVGTAKGSVSGGGKLNSRAQGWIKRKAGAGDADRKKIRAGAEWTFRADPPHVASARVLGERGVKRAMAKHRGNLARTMERDIRRQLKREEKKLNKG